MKPAKTATKQSSGIRTQLLETACNLFAEKGFRHATVAEICWRAGANTAAVNYYFHDKKTLYIEAWRLAFHRSLKAHPPDGGIPSNASAQERLAGHVLSLMQRIIDSENRAFDIVHKELANPTGLLAEVMRECIGPAQCSLASIVRELLGPKASNQQVQLCQMSILAQCFHPMMWERHCKLFTAGTKGGPLPLDVRVEVIAEHIVSFSLAGIRETRRRIESPAQAEQTRPRAKTHEL